MRFRETIRYMAPLAALPFVFGACAEEQPATTATGETEQLDVFSAGNIVTVRPGESAFTSVSSPDEPATRAIINDIAITDHQYPHGWSDDQGPEVGVDPVRLDAHVALSGSKSDYIDNDIACDTLRIDIDGLDAQEVYIGALALSNGVDDKAMITWPLEEDGTPSERVYLCMAEDQEPSDGVIMFMSDRAR